MAPTSRGDTIGEVPHVFIADNYTELIEAKSPQLLSMLATDYRVMRMSDLGVWFELAS